MKTILVVAAWRPELRGLARTVPVAPGLRLQTAIVGVGPVEAAIGAARALEGWRPESIILVGTAGVYAHAARRFPLGGVAVVGKMTFLTLEAVRGAAYHPKPMPLTARGQPRLCARLVGAGAGQVADVACPPGITRTRGAALAMAEASGASLENLEAFAVARAAAARRVPFAALLGIANRVGPSAHAQWVAHAAQAAAAACTALRAFLRS